jgi:hypothetical protein
MPAEEGQEDRNFLSPFERQCKIETEMGLQLDGFSHPDMRYSYTVVGFATTSRKLAGS